MADWGVSNRSINIIFIFLFSLALVFPIYYLLFLLRLYVDWWHSRWPADLRTTLCAPAPTGLPGLTFVGSSSFLPAVTGLTTRYNRSDRFTQEVLQRATSHVASSSERRQRLAGQRLVRWPLASELCHQTSHTNCKDKFQCIIKYVSARYLHIHVMFIGENNGIPIKS